MGSNVKTIFITKHFGNSIQSRPNQMHQFGQITISAGRHIQRQSLTAFRGARSSTTRNGLSFKSIQPRGYGKFGGKMNNQLMHEMAEEAAKNAAENSSLWKNPLSLQTFIKSPDIAYAFAEKQTLMRGVSFGGAGKPRGNLLAKFLQLSWTVSVLKRIARRIKRKRVRRYSVCI